MQFNPSDLKDQQRPAAEPPKEPAPVATALSDQQQAALYFARKRRRIAAVG